MGKFATYKDDRPKVKGKVTKLRKMDEGGGPYADNPTGPVGNSMPWTKGISGAAGFGAATVDAFAPTDAYGVRSNGAAGASGALKGAASGAAVGSVFGPEGTIIGAGAGLVVGGVEGILGNKKANIAKTNAINKMTAAQINTEEAGANARVAGNPSLKYGNQGASYYRFGGVMKGNGPTPPRMNKPMAAVQAKPRLMPNITEAPNRQMSKLGNGGIPSIPGTRSALSYNSTRLFRPLKSYKAQVASMAEGGNIPGEYTTYTNGGRLNSSLHQHRQSIAQPKIRGQKNAVTAPPVNPQPPMPQTQRQPPMPPQGLAPGQVQQMQQMMAQGNGLRTQAMGGKMEPMSSQDTKFNGASHAEGGIKMPQKGVEVEGGETANKDFVFSKKLGYAQKHEKIARQMGKAEKRPDSPLNRATTTALQRKTELLKGQQEAHKASMGMPNDLQQQGMPQMALGGDVDPKKPVVDPTKAPTYDASLLTDGKFMVTKPDGTLGQWGKPIPPEMQVPAALKMKPVIPVSDKATGTDNTYNTARGQQRGPAVATIHSNYKFGGKMRKMDGGGNTRGNYIDPGVTPNPVLPAFSIDTPPVNSFTLPTASPTPQASSDATGTGSKFADTANKLSPFLSNFVNATQKLPLPPVPVLNTEITPNTVDYSASRNEAVRATRGANKTARENLNNGAAVSATVAANLAGQDRAIGQANEAEQNTNAQIRNSAAAENAQIKASNNSLTNNYQNELTARQLKQQQLTSQNVANISEKLEGMKRDKSLNDLEAQKAVLGWMQNNNTGAGWEAVRPIVAKYVGPDALKTLDQHNATLQQYQKEDREDNRRAGNYGIFAKAMNYDPKNMTPEAYQAWLLNTRGGNIAPGKTKLGTVTDKEGNITYKTTE